MFPFWIVVVEKSAKPPIQRMSIWLCVWVNVLVFYGLPQTLTEDVVQSTATAIHTDCNVLMKQRTCESLRGELSPLVGIEY